MAGYALGAASLGRARHVDPRLLRAVARALEVSPQDAGFAAEQSRTTAEEAQLVAQGRSHTLKSHHIIDCRPGWAAAGYSGAVDLVPWDGSAFVWDWTRIYVLAAAVRQASIELGIPVSWGGCWDRLLAEIPGDGPAAMKAAGDDYVARKRRAGEAHPFVDGPHFELGRN